MFPFEFQKSNVYIHLNYQGKAGKCAIPGAGGNDKY